MTSTVSHNDSSKDAFADDKTDEAAKLENGTDTPSISQDSLSKHDDSARSIHGFKWGLVCVSLYVSCMMYGLDTTIAADVQAAVVARFGDVQQITWVGSGFPLGSVAVILPLGALCAKFDLKAIYIGSIILFEAGSALCGGAPSMSALIVGRVVAGMGGSGMYIGILNYMSMLTTNNERGRYISLIGLVWGTGAILGPTIGGAFSTSSATWRWAFYINLVVAAVCAPIYIFYLPPIIPPGSKDKSFMRKLVSLDWIGFTLFAGALACFTMALTFAGTTWAWDDGRTIACFVVFGVLSIVTFIQQKYCLLTTYENRMFPPGYLLKSRTQVLLCFETGATITNIFVPLYYIPLYFQFVHDDTAIKAAVRLLPFVLILVTTNMASGALLPRIGYYWAMYLATGIIMTIGGALMFTVKSDTAPANVYGYSALLAFGTGLTFQIGYTVGGVKVSLKNLPAADTGNIISLINIAQIGGTLICLVISGQIFQSLAVDKLKSAFGSGTFSDGQIDSMVAGAQSSVFETLSAMDKARAVDAITDAMSRVYALSIAAGALSLVCSLFMKRERLLGVEPVAGG